MKRVAFVMKLKAGCEAEYRRRHTEIWPDLADAIRQAGISHYSIYLHPESLLLFAIQDQSDPQAAAALSGHPTVRRWWDHMAPLMEVHPDHAPVCQALDLMFHQD